MAKNASMIRFLQRALGYSLTGSQNAQCFFFPWGGGSNGKSTLLNTFLDLLGDYGTLAPADLLLVKKGEVHPTEKVDLFGKRFAVCQEVEEGRRWAENTIKQLTGGERVKARRMREDYWEFEPTHKLWIAANHKPIVRGTDYAIWRRIKLLPFTVTIPEEEKDEELREKLLKEGPGILRWAVEGCLTWQRDGLGIPPEVKEATESYRVEMDVFGEFLADCYKEDPKAWEPAADLYESFASWCAENGETPSSKRTFGVKLQERGLTPGKQWVEGKEKRGWYGLRKLVRKTYRQNSTQVSDSKEYSYRERLINPDLASSSVDTSYDTSRAGENSVRNGISFSQEEPGE